MGMFDTIKVAPGHLHCPAGHPIVELQTKDFDPALDTYYISDERQFFLLRRGFERTNRLRKQVGSTFSAYTPCAACVAAAGGEYTDAAWNEWDFVVEQDGLTIWFRTSPK